MRRMRVFAGRRDRRRAQALTRAVEQLTPATRRAMLTAIEADELIVGAYTDRRGRVCPMLAAHRRGARGDVGSFPHAWDGFAGCRRPRAATDRELEVLRALLQETLTEQTPVDRPPPVADPVPAREAGVHSGGDPAAGVSSQGGAAAAAKRR